MKPKCLEIRNSNFRNLKISLTENSPVFKSPELSEKIKQIKYFFNILFLREKAISALREFHENKFHSEKSFSFTGNNSPTSNNSIQKCAEYLKQILNLFIDKNDFKMAALIYQLLGEVFYLNFDYLQSIFYYTQAYLIYDTFCMYNEQNKLCELIGRCYIKIENYEKALIVYKNQLIIGWRSRNIEIELKAYDNIGMSYYYLNKLDEAQFYHNRIWEGVVESNKSPWILIAQNSRDLRIRLYKKLNIYLTNNQFKYSENADLIQARSEIIKSEIEISSVGCNTPRIMSDILWDYYTPKDLPSPRKLSDPIIKHYAQKIKVPIEIRRSIACKFLNVKPYVFLYKKHG